MTDWVNMDEACHILERAYSTVHTYAREGFFRSKIVHTGGSERHMLCCREDLLEIAAMGIRQARKEILGLKRKQRESRPRCIDCTAIIEEIGPSPDPGRCEMCYRWKHGLPSPRQIAYRDVIEGRVR